MAVVAYILVFGVAEYGLSETSGDVELRARARSREQIQKAGTEMEDFAEPRVF